jgi:predicted TIM-barrel fold metal-dependent hydrolase
MFVWSLKDPRVGDASCRVYNDWVHERIGTDSPRCLLAGIIPTWSVQSAIAEAQRNASNGFAAHLLPLVGTWNDPKWEPLWDAFDDMGLPVVMHLGTGGEMNHYTGPGAAIASALTNQSMAPRTVGLLTMSGVLERHPDLHFVLVETDAGWMPWTVNALDSFSKDHPHWVRPKLAEKPSFYVRRQIHAVFMDDQVAVANHEFIGADSLLWGNDYPHDEGLYPNSQEVIAKLSKDMSPQDKAQIFGGNAARLFNFDVEAIAQLPQPA